MYLIVEENQNCSAEERVFSSSGEEKIVLSVQVETPDSSVSWCDVVGVEESGQFTHAKAVQVEDSGAGLAWLVYGGLWGLRFRKKGDTTEWSLENKRQWGEPFKVLDISAQDIHFQSSSR